MIVCGVALFMFKDGKSSDNETVFGVGEFLLLVSLTLGNLPIHESTSFSLKVGS